MNGLDWYHFLADDRGLFDGKKKSSHSDRLPFDWGMTEMKDHELLKGLSFGLELGMHLFIEISDEDIAWKSPVDEHGLKLRQYFWKGHPVIELAKYFIYDLV